MPFNPADIYSVTAGVELYNYWNPFVTKHDASSFYNWEQDNLPLYDLEERTDYLWERFGWAGSSLPGMALCVSSSLATDNNNVFTSLEDAINALPEVIRMPVLIEVATSGNLGSINLNNIKFTGDGKLEIVNRVFTEFVSASAVSTDYDSALGTIRTTSSVDAANIITDTSVVSLSEPTASLWPSNTEKWKGLAFVSEVKNLNGNRPDKCSVVVHDDQVNSWRPTTSTFFTPDIADAGSVVIDGATSLDWNNTKLSLNGALTLTRSEAPISGANSGGQMVGFLTNNYLDSIKIVNCDGPIYIRGFGVDARNTSDWGIIIKNSEGITLENCGVTRALIGGVDISNSEVNLRRRFVSSRNYNHTSTATRTATDNYGLRSSNSTISFVTDSYINGNDSLFAFQENDYGMHLSNSKLLGEDSTAYYKCSHNHKAGLKLVNSVVDVDGYLDIYSNHVGCEAISSELMLDGFICQYNKQEGLLAKDSSVVYGKKEGTRAYTSLFGNDGIAYSYRLGFFGNGKNISMFNSSMMPARRPNMFYNHDQIFIAGHQGVTVDEEHNPGAALIAQPGIYLNNSKAKLIHCVLTTAKTSSTGNITGADYLTNIPVLGSVVQACNNSKIEFLGSQYGANLIVGRNSNTYNDAGIYVSDNSTCKISGPTFIGQFDTAILADRNSSIVISPHDNDSENTYDEQGFGLSSTANHTSVEIHAYSRCLVADNGSTITMRDLGDAIERYPTSIEQASSTDYFSTRETVASSITGGSLVLLPNPKIAATVPAGVYPTRLSYEQNPTNYRFASTTVNTHPYNYYLANIGTITASDFRTNLSKGGVCVHALNGSTVRAQNVCFLTSPENTDWPYYDHLESAAGCSDLRIWAISSGSRLEANNLAVSSTYPSLAGYTGPSATYGFEYSAFAHQPYLPSIGHPDTSTLSILDFYGIGGEVSAGILSDRMQAWSKQRWGGALNHFGVSSSENSGPFRLYFDVDPAAKSLNFFSSTAGGYSLDDNRPYQIMAQGYFLSGPAVTQEDIAQELYGDLLTLSSTSTDFESSGYYHTSSFVNASRAVVTLDESAANTFANAKHCSHPFLGREKLVNIYRATNKAYGEGYSHTTTGYGAGFTTTNIFDVRRTL